MAPTVGTGYDENAAGAPGNRPYSGLVDTTRDGGAGGDGTPVPEAPADTEGVAPADTEGVAPADTEGVVLAEQVRRQVIQISADVLGRLKPEEVPAPLRALAKFTPARRRQRGAVALAAVVDSDPEFRERVAQIVTETLPALVTAVRSGASTAASDPVDVATVAYLVRPDGWPDVVRRAAAALAPEPAAAVDADELDRLRSQVATLTARAKVDAAAVRDAVSAAEAAAADQLRELTAALRQRTGQMRAAERALAAAQAAQADAEARAEKAELARDADARRLRARIAELERAGEAVRRDARADRDVDRARLWLLVEALTDAASGLRRELSLPPPSLRPGDAVAAALDARDEQDGPDAAQAGARTLTQPASLDRILALPGVHLIVDGYNVTKTGYGALSLSQQRERLVGALAGVAARYGCEVTVAFDGSTRPPVQPRTPRGVRVLFSDGQIADDLIRTLVLAEPAGRTLLVVTSDQQIVADVRRMGAWTAPSSLLLARLT
jgi:hypothetical protein